jgi:transmembrane sensor
MGSRVYNHGMRISEPRSRSGRTVEREASQWVARHALGSMTEGDVAAFEQWRADDPRNAATFAEMTGTLDSVGDAGPALRETHRSQLRHEARRRRIGASVGAACVAGIFLFSSQMSWLMADMRTGAEAPRSYRLADGSTLWLDGKSAIDMDFSQDKRVVRLISGRMHVRVAHEQRPFLVEAGGGVARDIGTAFDVALADNGASVIVTEGEVAAESAGTQVGLHRGEGAQWQSGMAPIRLGAARLMGETAWRDGRLVFDREPMAQVVEKLNRYSAKRIILWNAKGGRQLVNGVVRIDQVDRSLPSLAKAQRLTMTDLGFAILLR